MGTREVTEIRESILAAREKVLNSLSNPSNGKVQAFKTGAITAYDNALAIIDRVSTGEYSYTKSPYNSKYKP